MKQLERIKAFQAAAFYCLLFFCFLLTKPSQAQSPCPQTQEKKDFLLATNDKKIQLYEKHYKALKRDTCHKKWTVLIYMQADNDLSPYALWDLYEMEKKLQASSNQGTSTDKLDVLVQLDLLKSPGLRRYHVFQTDKPYKKTNSVINKDFFEDETQGLQELDSPLLKTILEKPQGELQSQKEGLLSFLEWGMKTYPSDHYMLVIWGHGKGYFDGNQSSPLPSSSSSQQEISSWFQGGVAFDYSNFSFLSAQDLKEVLSFTKKFYQKIDLLTMDACLMQTLEMNLSVSREVDYYLASSQIQNYMGLPYRALWDTMNENINSLTPYKLAQTIPSVFETSLKRKRLYESDQWNDSYFSFTYSAISSRELNVNMKPFNLLSHFQDFSFLLHQYLKEDTTRKDIFLLELKDIPSFTGNYRDIGNLAAGVLYFLDGEENEDEDFLCHQKSSLACQLKIQTQKLMDSLQKNLVTYSYGDDYIDTRLLSGKRAYFLGFFKGLSVWIPDSEEKFNIQWSYMKHSPLMKENSSSWKELLFYLFNKKSAPSSSYTNQGI